MGDFEKRSWQAVSVMGKSIEAKQSLISQLREVAEEETAWLEKNRLLYTQKREQVDHLTKGRGLTGGEVTAEEQKPSKHVALYESRRSGMWNLAKEINEKEQRLDQINSSNSG